jgi:hypothetical protein
MIYICVQAFRKPKAWCLPAADLILRDAAIKKRSDLSRALLDLPNRILAEVRRDAKESLLCFSYMARRQDASDSKAE